MLLPGGESFSKRSSPKAWLFFPRLLSSVTWCSLFPSLWESAFPGPLLGSGSFHQGAVGGARSQVAPPQPGCVPSKVTVHLSFHIRSMPIPPLLLREMA